MQDIAAIRCVSVSELYKSNPTYTEKFFQDNPETFRKLVYECGIDTDNYYEIQVNIHRNNFGEIYSGTRAVGMERTDPVWLGLGFASTEAKDRAKGSKLLNDLYRSKGLTMDRQSGVFEPEEFEKPGYVETEDDTEVDQAVDDSIWDLQVKQLADFEMQRDVIATDETKQQKEKE